MHIQVPLTHKRNKLYQYSFISYSTDSTRKNYLSTAISQVLSQCSLVFFYLCNLLYTLNWINILILKVLLTLDELNGSAVRNTTKLHCLIYTQTTSLSTLLSSSTNEAATLSRCLEHLACLAIDRVMERLENIVISMCAFDYSYCYITLTAKT